MGGAGADANKNSIRQTHPNQPTPPTHPHKPQALCMSTTTPASSTTPATSRLQHLAAHLASQGSMAQPKPKRSPITSHILDTTLGKPAANVALHLEYKTPTTGQWSSMGRGTTNADGRVETLLPVTHVLLPGVYRITFDVASYFKAIRSKSFYPEVTIVFEVEKVEEHYHVPLLLTPFSYSTYRGS